MVPCDMSMERFEMYHFLQITYRMIQINVILWRALPILFAVIGTLFQLADKGHISLGVIVWSKHT